MYGKTLRTTVHQMYESVQSIAEKNPNIFFDKKDFERILGVAKEIFSENDVIQGMDAGDSDRLISFDLAAKLAILKAQLDEHFVKIASEKLGMPMRKGRLLR